MSDTLIEVNFPKLNHFWMDSGLLGLYEIAKKEHPEDVDIKMELKDDGVSFRGTESNLDSFFHKTYESLLSEYYNTSKKIQREENAGFYYDSIKDEFIRYPKVNTMGIAGLIFDKGPRPIKGKCKYLIDKDTKKKILPPEYSHLQDRFDDFIGANNLGKHLVANLPIDGPNAYKKVPKVNINVKSKKDKGICFLCGQPSHSLTDLKESTFPTISGSSLFSFVSGGQSAEKVCWKCDFIGKFVPFNGFYVMSSDSIHMYFPYSSSLEKMSKVYRDLEPMHILDPDLYMNFENLLGSYFSRFFEQLFTFNYTLYRRVLARESINGSIELDLDKMCGVMLSTAPIEFFTLHAQKFSKTQMVKNIFPFNNSIYLFRLFNHLEKNSVNIEEMMRILLYCDKNNKCHTIVRNRICENILKKHSIVGLVEQHVFRINKSEQKNIKQLYDFVILYEKVINEGGTGMDQATIDTAVSLGKTIGISISHSGKRGKGDLFKLRKARKPDDFLNEINRIQMKYDALITADLYNKGQEFIDNFTEFKHFCMIAALNTYNAGNRKNQTTETNTK